MNQIKNVKIQLDKQQTAELLAILEIASKINAYESLVIINDNSLVIKTIDDYYGQLLRAEISITTEYTRNFDYVVKIGTSDLKKLLKPLKTVDLLIQDNSLSIAIKDEIAEFFVTAKDFYTPDNEESLNDPYSIDLLSLDLPYIFSFAENTLKALIKRVKTIDKEFVIVNKDDKLTLSAQAEDNSLTIDLDPFITKQPDINDNFQEVKLTTAFIEHLVCAKDITKKHQVLVYTSQNKPVLLSITTQNSSIELMIAPVGE